MHELCRVPMMWIVIFKNSVSLIPWSEFSEFWVKVKSSMVMNGYRRGKEMSHSWNYLENMHTA